MLTLTVILSAVVAIAALRN